MAASPAGYSARAAEVRRNGRNGRMLFHIKQSHAPKDCPYGKGGSQSLFDGDSKDVKIHGYWPALQQHRLTLLSRPRTSRTFRPS